MNKVKLALYMVKSDVINRKMLSILILYFFILQIFWKPVKSYSIEVQTDISVCGLPFILSNSFFLVIFWGINIYFFADILFVDKTIYFLLVRMKKICWTVVQLIRIFFLSIILTTSLFAVHMIALFPYLKFTTCWGSLITTLSLTDAVKRYDILFELPYYVLAHYSGGKAMLILYALCIVTINFVGNLMFLTGIALSRTVSLLSAGLCAILPVMAENISVKFPNIYYYMFPSWVQMTKIRINYNFEYPSLEYVFSVLICSTVLLSGVSIFWICKTDISNSRMGG